MTNGKEDFIKKLKALWADKRPYKKRLLYAGSAMLAACFTFIFFGPFEMVAFSGTSLSYGYKDVFFILLFAMLAVWVVGSLLTALLKGKVYNTVVSLVFAATVGGYLQALLFNGVLGTLTGDAVNWGSHAYSMFINTAFWGLVITLVLLLLYLSRDIWRKAVIFLSAFLVIIQMAPTAMILMGAYREINNTDVKATAFTVEDMYEYSKNDNIFVFVLDRLDYDYIEEVLAEDSEFFDRLDGFTAYTNAISTFARTQPALAHILTGESKTAYVTPSQQYFKDAWTNDGKEILAELSGSGYKMNIYSNMQYMFSDADYVQKYISNVNSKKYDVAPVSVLKKLLRLSAYRYLPTACKPFLEADTNYYNTGVFKESECEIYSFNDSGYAAGFLDAAADTEDKNFKMYHFQGPHSPHTMNADGTKSDKITSAKEQTMGCFNILYSAFDKMKELGIYENATIIITGDHGAAIDDSKPLVKATRVGLFYKPSGSAGSALVRSAAPVGNENIPATIVKATGKDYAVYGRALDDIAENEELTRFYYKSVCPKGSSANEHEVYKYAVTGDAAVFENWKVDSIIKVIKDGNFY